MFKYTLIILLVNTYNFGWSSSLHLKSNGNVDATKELANNLLFLANKCHHQFISFEMQDKSADCGLSSIENIKYLKCSIFYDINKKLCNSSLDLNYEDFIKKMKNKLNVIEFCADTTSWSEIDLQIDPHYSKMFKRIFSDSHLCNKFCESQDIFIEDVDYYCKYYKWGQDILTKAKSHDIPMNQSDIPSITLEETHGVQFQTLEGQKLESNANNLSDNLILTSVNEQTNNFKNEYSEMPSNQEEANVIASEIVDDAKLKESHPTSSIVNQEQFGPDVAVAQQLGIIDFEQLPLKQDSINLVAEELNKTDVLNQPDDENRLTETNISTAQNLPNEDALLDKFPKVHPKLQVVNNQADLGDNGQVSEEDSGNVLSELDMMDDTDFDENLDLGSSKDSVKSITFHREPNLREVYTSVMQESFTEDKEDHFFSLFLTGVVLVIFLYVLYHNKNKVSKMVMGVVGKRASHHALPTKIRY